MITFCQLQCAFWQLLVSISKDSQQIQEHVDEIQIEGKASHQSHFLGLFIDVCAVFAHHLLDFLSIVSCQSYKDQHTYIVDDPAQSVAYQEYIDHSSDDQADEGHEQDTTQFAQILFGDKAYQTHGAEGAGSNQKCGGDATLCISQEYRRERYTGEQRIKYKHQGSCQERHLVDAS